MTVKKKRLFTAIDLPVSWLDEIESTSDRLCEQDVRGRFTPRDRLHLTLNFLGETEEEDSIKRLLAALDRSEAPWSSAGSGGLFRRRRGGDLIVWQIENHPALSTYQGLEAEALASLGIRRDRRAYKPHLTLARDAKGTLLGSPELVSFFGKPVAFQAEELVLYWSHLVNGRLVYSPIARFPFGGETGR